MKMHFGKRWNKNIKDVVCRQYANIGEFEENRKREIDYKNYNNK